MDPTKPADVTSLPTAPTAPDQSLEHVFSSLTESLAGALELKLGDQTISLAELASVSEERLRGEDTAARSRALYTLALLRLLEYMRTDHVGKDSHQQAAVALRYVQHAEEESLKALQMGRTSQDVHLKRKVDEVRASLQKLADYKAKAQSN